MRADLHFFFPLSLSLFFLAEAECLRSNRDSPEFYDRMEDHASERGLTDIIVGGDWNLVLDPIMDYCNYTYEVGVGLLCRCPGKACESIRKRAHTQFVREHSVTVVSAR